jgi:hypothetical protein
MLRCAKQLDGTRMFIGHFGLGFAAKRAAPEVSLGMLILACQLADILWPTFVLVGLERFEIRPGITRVTPLDFIHYPWSHSLLALVAWGVLAAAIYRALRKGRARAVVVLALLVVSHWFLDLIVHRPDLPLVPHGAARYGLDLWDSLPATLAVEVPLFAAGVAIYAFATTSRDRIGTWAWWALVAFLWVAYVVSLTSPPPPSVSAVAWVNESGWLLVLWGWWIDRHRAPRKLAAS